MYGECIEDNTGDRSAMCVHGKGAFRVGFWKLVGCFVQSAAWGAFVLFGASRMLWQYRTHSACQVYLLPSAGDLPSKGAKETFNLRPAYSVVVSTRNGHSRAALAQGPWRRARSECCKFASVWA